MTKRDDVIRVLKERKAALTPPPRPGHPTWDDLDAVTGRLDLLCVDIRELLKLIKGESSLYISRPHLREHVSEMERHLEVNLATPPRKRWWQRC